MLAGNYLTKRWISAAGRELPFGFVMRTVFYQVLSGHTVRIACKIAPLALYYPAFRKSNGLVKVGDSGAANGMYRSIAEGRPAMITSVSEAPRCSYRQSDPKLLVRDNRPCRAQCLLRSYLCRRVFPSSCSRANILRERGDFVVCCQRGGSLSVGFICAER